MSIGWVAPLFEVILCTLSQGQWYILLLDHWITKIMNYCCIEAILRVLGKYTYTFINGALVHQITEPVVKWVQYQAKTHTYITYFSIYYSTISLVMVHCTYLYHQIRLVQFLWCFQYRQCRYAGVQHLVTMYIQVDQWCTLDPGSQNLYAYLQ